MFGTDSPWTSTSPSSGYSSPTMCLMQTDLPVPDGPRIIEILSFGMPMFRPRRILLRPNALCTSTNSTASSTPEERFLPVCHLYSSSGCCWPCCLVSSLISSSDGRPRIRTPEDLGAEHADQVDQHDVEDHRLRRGRAHPHRPAAGRIAVVTADEHDDRGHDHGFDQAEEEVGWVLEHP